MPPAAPPPVLSLLDSTKQLLMADPRNSHAIAVQAEVSYFWLRKFRAGTISDPATSRIEKLNRELTRYKHAQQSPA